MPIDLRKTYLLLENDGDALKLPVTDDFWQQLSGTPTAPVIKRLAKSDGRMLAAYEMKEDWDHWEMHPGGDEVLILVSGRMTLVLEEGSGERLVEMTAGQTFVVPKGVWHTGKVPEPSTLIGITAGKGTEHRPA
ncbi:MAG: cupin domain-containing protein [Planctomycetes bacterium]|nr:cupin domain-containing protein [Planctomycetota bacterium]